MDMAMYRPLGLYLFSSCLHICLSRNDKEDFNKHLVGSLTKFATIFVLMALVLFFFGDNIPIRVQHMTSSGCVGPMMTHILLITHVNFRYFIQWLSRKTHDEYSIVGEQSALQSK
ncbi:hypothetical protein BGZ74_001908 [Mortierella antarctica]|nr:hypothetical protein BGZ74_001908 [Mortierella antarctica]